MCDLIEGRDISDGLGILSEFTELMQSKGTKVGDPEVLEDAVALSGVSQFPARIKCALLGWMAFKDALSQVIDSPVSR